MKRFELIFIAAAGAAIFFCIGFFFGQDSGRSVDVTVERHEPSLESSEFVAEVHEGGGSGLVNINTADEEELDTLPGIGPVLAGRIIKYRDENGPFSSVEDILNVYGIGEGTYEEICDLITVQ